MLKNELYKLIQNRFLMITLTALLVINGAVSWYSAYFEKRVQSPNADEFIDYYIDNYEDVKKHEAEIADFRLEQLRKEKEAADLGLDYTSQSYPDIYGYEGISDKTLIDSTKNMINSAASYRADIEEVIERARSNKVMLENDGHADSYSVKYQDRVIEEYQKILDSNLRIGLEFSRGWNGFYTYDAGNILFLFFTVVLASTVFLQEKQSGTWNLIRVTRHGRLRTGVCKMASFAIVSAGVLILIMASTFAIYGAVCGFSSPHNVLQSLEDFRFSTLQITVGGYLPIHLLMRYSASLVLGTAVCLISVFANHAVQAYVMGGLIVGINYFLHYFEYINAESPLKNLNLLTISQTSYTGSRLRTLNIFGNAVDLYLCWTLLALFLFALFVVLTLIVYCKGYVNVRAGVSPLKVISAFINKLGVFKKRSAASPVKARSHSLLSWEFHKRLISDGLIWLLILLIAFKCLPMFESLKQEQSLSDTIYHEYMTAYAGEWSQEKSDSIAAEAARIKETVNNYGLYTSMWNENAISENEYRDFINEYNEAYLRRSFFEQIILRDQYLAETAASSSVTPSFVYDTGWNAIFGAESDLLLYFSILILICGIHAANYRTNSSSGGFAPILRTTVKGRQLTLRTKLTVSVLCTTVLTVLYIAADLIFAALKYDLPLPSASAASLAAFPGLPAGLSIGAFLVLYVITKLLINILLCLLAFALSALLHHTIPVMSIMLGITALPYILTKLRLPIGFADYHMYATATPLWCRGSFGLPEILTMILMISATVILLITAERKHS